MKYIASAALLLSVLIFLLFNYKSKKQTQYTVIKTVDSTNNFVVFSIDSNTTNKNQQRKRLDFYYHDSLAIGQPLIISGKNTKALLTAPTLLFEASAKQTPFLIFPGETINLKYAGSDSVQLYIQGNRQRTNELNFFRDLVQKTGPVYYAFTMMPYHKKVRTLDSIRLLEKAIGTVAKIRLNLLETYAVKFPVSKGFAQIASNTIKSTAITDSLLLYFNNQKLLKERNLYDQLLAEKLTTVKKLQFMPYQVFLNTCNTLVSLLLNKNLLSTISSTTDFVNRFDFVNRSFTGDIRNFLLSSTLNRAENNDVAVSKEYLQKYNSICTNVIYKNMIANKSAEKNADLYTTSNNKLLSDDGKTVQDFQTVISSYKGKIILLDFWASWCSPCRGEMPYLHQLKREFKDKKVAFVSLSTDIKVKDWLKANKEESLENEPSFLLLNSEKSQFVKQYKINSIPRYFLINKDGKMIHADAPRPSDPKLKLLIDKYL